MAPIHIDETAGLDTTGTGALDQPYQSLGVAVFTHGATVAFLTRKDSTGTYEEPTQSSLKKAKKTAEGLEKKKKKQEELAGREAKEEGEAKEKRERLLEDSKKIKLEEDSSLPKAIKVRNLLLYLTTESNIILSRKSPTSPPYDRSGFAYLDGSTACVARKSSYFWSYETVPAISRLFYPASL